MATVFNISETRTTPNAYTILKHRYLKKNENGEIIETPDELYMRVARHIASGSEEFGEDTERLTEEFYLMMASDKFKPNSPTLVNAGTEKGCLSACFTLSPDDTMESIMQTCYDSAMIEKWGGGIGFGVSNLRPKNDAIHTTHGKALGAVETLKMLSYNASKITQGSFRKGAHMGQMIVSHPEIRDFIHCKDNFDELKNFNISVQVTDAFMNAVLNNSTWDLINPKDGSVTETIDAKELWNEIIESTHKTGDPGIVFMDRVWETAPNPQLGKIMTSNPCWAGDTKVWTIDGAKEIQDLVGQEVPVLTTLDNGTMAFRMMRNIRKTGSNEKTLKITLKAYRKSQRKDIISEIILTPNHNLYLLDGTKVQAKDLKIGDRLESVYKNKANQKGYLNLKNSVECDMEHRIVASYHWGSRPNYPEYHVDHIDEDKTNNHPSNLKIMLAREHNAHNMWADKNPMNRFPEKNYFKNGFYGEQNGNAKLTDDDVKKIIEMYDCDGVTQKQLGEIFNVTQGHISRIVCRAQRATVNHKIISIEEGPNIDVYNGTVDETHRYYVEVAENEGILSANCGEEFIENGNNCCLGSINLARFVSNGKWDWKELERIVRKSVLFLDNVIQVNQFPLPFLREINLQTRRIGLGVMGWADALIELNIEYDSELAFTEAENVGKFIKDIAWDESAILATKRGAFPEYENSRLKDDGFPPVRHSSVITCAPTGTISRIANCSSGIEPLFSLAWNSNVLWNDDDPESSTQLVDCPAQVRTALKRMLFERNIDSPNAENLWLIDLMEHPENIEQLAEYGLNANIFRTAMMISPESHVRMQAAWQKNVTNAVSKTINMDNGATIEDIENVYLMAWKTKCKGVTVYRDGIREIEVLTTKSRKDIVVAEKMLEFIRPSGLSGITEKIETGHGSLYVTLNSNGHPREIISNIGKAGGCHGAYLESISRLISLSLQRGVDYTEIVSQLNGITCCPVWDRGEQIKSPADGISKAMTRHFTPDGYEEEMIRFENKQLPLMAAQNNYRKCHSCNGKIISEGGCETCISCGEGKCA